jgi:hypothetical protein
VIREVQIKTIVKYQFTPVRAAKSKNQKETKIGEM